MESKAKYQARVKASIKAEQESAALVISDANHVKNVMLYIARVGTIPGTTPEAKRVNALELMGCITNIVDTLTPGWDK